ncbi:hypothetical protein MAPG_04989 [Magnaporthiopsis poae ATCC 64411]|uniref:Uncharacterized protein n=1 Tax=Magnaporthiopsis poae (strain ATCC 64411 / 73-15) TaxID=644358 RepID=A0A0C4DY78_MAGP6|nr:hypothetical protein MAPG_04989 [Magnaporthiopsis poae ATCC 64411]
MAAMLAEPRREGGTALTTSRPQSTSDPQRIMVERTSNIAAGTGCAATLVLVLCIPFCDFISSSRLTGRLWRVLSFVLVLLLYGFKDGPCVAGSTAHDHWASLDIFSSIPQIIPGRKPAKVHAPNPKRHALGACGFSLYRALPARRSPQRFPWPCELDTPLGYERGTPCSQKGSQPARPAECLAASMSKADGQLGGLDGRGMNSQAPLSAPSHPSSIYLNLNGLGHPGSSILALQSLL